MSGQSYIVTGHAREQLDELLAAGKEVRLIETFGGDIERVVDVTSPDREDRPSYDELAAAWEKRDALPPTGLLEALRALAAGWDQAATEKVANRSDPSNAHATATANTYHGCAWELRELIKTHTAQNGPTQ